MKTSVIPGARPGRRADVRTFRARARARHRSAMTRRHAHRRRAHHLRRSSRPPDEPLRLWKPFAGGGDPGAQYRLGRMPAYGEGVIDQTVLSVGECVALAKIVLAGIPRRTRVNSTGVTALVRNAAATDYAFSF